MDEAIRQLESLGGLYLKMTSDTKDVTSTATRRFPEALGDVRSCTRIPVDENRYLANYILCSNQLYTTAALATR